MANVSGGPEKSQHHPTMRRTILALAEVRIFQAQVLDNDGKVVVIPIWQCGTDIWTALTIDGLFDENLRKEAPKWIKEQLKALPAERRFSWEGIPEGGEETVPTEVTRPAKKQAASLEDDDVPGVRQG